MDQETLRGVLAVLSHLRGRRGGAHPFRTKRNILAAAAATLLRVIGGDVILTAVRVKDLENAKGNSQQRIVVLAHSDFSSTSGRPTDGQGGSWCPRSSSLL